MVNSWSSVALSVEQPPRSRGSHPSDYGDEVQIQHFVPRLSRSYAKCVTQEGDSSDADKALNGNTEERETCQRRPETLKNQSLDRRSESDPLTTRPLMQRSRGTCRLP